MSNQVYRRLARHLDKLPGGFPSTESGVELRILARLFTPGEAELALKLTFLPEKAKVIAYRIGAGLAETEARLEELAAKGLIFSIKPNSGPTLYMSAQYVIGIWEYHVNDLDENLIRDMNEYIPHLMDASQWEKAPQLRTIPVGKSIQTGMEIMAYEQAEQIIRSQKYILVAPCICRKEHKMVGEGCDRPEETCLVFGWGASYYERNGLGRRIQTEEALDILKKADKSGLVLQPGNAQKPTNICCCCGCCCQVLVNLKKQPQPAKLVSTPFRAEVSQDDCTACGVCVDRCQMDALALEGEQILLDVDRCIGCGLCVSTCPGRALKLVRKPEKSQPMIPKNAIESAIHLGRARGKFNSLNLTYMQLKSKVDRLLSARVK